MSAFGEFGPITDEHRRQWPGGLEGVAAVAREYETCTFATTAVAAVERVLDLKGGASPETLVVHVVGGQLHVEGVDAMWRPLAALVARKKCRRARLVIVGPQMQTRAAVKVGGALEVAHAKGLYDLWACTNPQEPAPGIVLLFHPGFWGYDCWRNSIRHLLENDAPFVVTSYTPQEAELDELAIGLAILDPRAAESYVAANGGDVDEVRDEACDLAAKSLTWLWRTEVNPHRAERIRETKTAPPGHEYRENHAWMAIDPEDYDLPFRPGAFMSRLSLSRAAQSPSPEAGASESAGGDAATHV